MTTAEPIRDFAPAKINLFLHVGDKRPDGYHALQSLAVFATVGDELSFSRARDLTLSLDGPFASSLDPGGGNLVLRAARALGGEGAKIALTKNLPVASGIGGGSADAAAALRGLSRLWDLNLPEHRLREIAATLGSDVPVCVSRSPAWMEGRGEILAPVASVPGLHLLLVNPGVAVATADVFRALKTRRGTGMARPTVPFRDAGDLLNFLQATTNDLEAPALSLQPVIAEALRAIEAMRGVLLSRMSGSGATCFGIFENEARAKDARAALSAAHPSWWVRAAAIAQ